MKRIVLVSCVHFWKYLSIMYIMPLYLICKIWVDKDGRDIREYCSLRKQERHIKKFKGLLLSVFIKIIFLIV